MAATKKSSKKQTEKYRPPLSQEAEDAEMIALAYDQARQQLRDGTAPGPVVLYLMKKGSEKERLELEKLREENKLLIAKTKALEGAKRTEEMLEAYINSLRLYQGQSNDGDDDADDFY